MEPPSAIYRFGRFELQPRERRLLLEGTPIALPGKAFDLLVCLVAQAPRLVRKETLFETVWPDTIVEESNLNYTVSIVRKALLDRREGECWIETVPRQGYRFVANVERIDDRHAPAPTVARAERPSSPLVQRESEIEALKTALVRARSGRRQLVFITGEAGIGKTSVVDRFLTDVRSSGQVSIARGQCVEQHGAAEAYMPVLEALGRMGRQDDGQSLVETLDRFAPSWLVQMPGLVRPEQLAALHQRLLGQTRERMLREIEEALVVATAVTPIVLLLEDLHWTDLSTLDLLTRVARGEDPARLLIIGTYRSPDALATSHPLHATVQELQLRGACQHLPLAPFSRASIAAYLDDRVGGAVPAGVIDLIQQRTEGSPLFIAALVESWRASGVLFEAEGKWCWQSDVAEQALAAPESLRAFIEEQIRRIPRLEREVLEAAAIVGAEFSAAIVASILERPLEEMETTCSQLARIGQFIRAGGPMEYPDGTLSDRYEFVHAFYMEVLKSFLPAGRKVRLHQQIALMLEALYSDHAAEIATRLATHFVEARDTRNALKYLQLAAGQSLARSAPREAITRLEQAERMLPRIADIDERHEHELSIQSMLATALTATRGFSDPGAEAAFRRAYELARRLKTPRLFPIAFGLATTLELRGRYHESQAIMEEHLPVQEARGGYVSEARDLLACSTYHQGAFELALQHAQKGLGGIDADRHSVLTGCFGEHPGIGCYTWAALSLWFLGRAQEALAHARRAVTLAEGPAHLYSLANARAQRAILHQLRREPIDAQRWAALTIELGNQQGFAHRVAIGHVLHGWATGAMNAITEGLGELEQGLDAARQIGIELDRPYFLALLAEILAADGRFERALATIDEGQREASKSRSFFYEAELWRLRGSILLTAYGRQRAHEAEDCFARAVDTATRQAARLLQLRAELARASSPELSIRKDAARETLGSLYASFTEGFDTPDLVETARFLGRVDAASA